MSIQKPFSEIFPVRASSPFSCNTVNGLTRFVIYKILVELNLAGLGGRANLAGPSFTIEILRPLCIGSFSFILSSPTEDDVAATTVTLVAVGPSTLKLRSRRRVCSRSRDALRLLVVVSFSVAIISTSSGSGDDSNFTSLNGTGLTSEMRFFSESVEIAKICGLASTLFCDNHLRFRIGFGFFSVADVVVLSTDFRVALFSFSLYDRLMVSFGLPTVSGDLSTLD